MCEHGFKFGGGARPVPIPPRGVRAYALRLRTAIAFENFHRLFGAPEIEVGARFKNASLRKQIDRHVGLSGKFDRGQRLLRFAIAQIDHREIRRDLRATNPFKPFFHLVLQQHRRLLEKIERDETTGQTAHHAITVGADGRQILEIVKKPQRLNGFQLVGFPIEEEALENIVHVRA